MKAFKTILYSLAAVFLFSACSKEENEIITYRFVHIMQNESSIATINSKANSIGTYSIYLSAPQLLEPISVSYKITVGNGLQEGLDYEILTDKTTLTFLPGIYDMPIRIKWMSNPLDLEKDNSIKIEITSVSNSDYSIGLPGKDKLQRSFTITKVQQ